MIQRFFALCKNPAIVIFCGSLLLGGCGGNVTAEDTKLVMGTVARLTVRADEITSQAALRDGLAVLTQTEEDADGAILATVESSAGTGAWTGTLAASVLDMDFKETVLAVTAGVLIAGIIMALVSLGVFGIIR